MITKHSKSHWSLFDQFKAKSMLKCCTDRDLLYIYIYIAQKMLWFWEPWKLTANSISGLDFLGLNYSTK